MHKPTYYINYFIIQLYIWYPATCFDVIIRELGTNELPDDDTLKTSKHVGAYYCVIR